MYRFETLKKPLYLSELSNKILTRIGVLMQEKIELLKFILILGEAREIHRWCLQ